jgi:Uma2 family endonuclease
MAVRTIQREATIQDLYRLTDNGKAELVNGELILMSPTGVAPGRAGGEIYVSLRQHERQVGGGYAFPDNVGFLVNLPHRKSFSPDAAFWTGPLPGGGQFLPSAPAFAAEVRSENDYGPSAEQALADKRADYFAAGTQVVWDVDVLRDEEVRSYRASDPDHSLIFRRGDMAHAEPAVPGWSLPVDDLLPSLPP